MQLEMNLRRNFVVPNFWGPVFHVTDEQDRTVRHGEQPQFFPAVACALCWCATRGIAVEVHPDCQWWSTGLLSGGNSSQQ